MIIHAAACIHSKVTAVVASEETTSAIRDSGTFPEPVVALARSDFEFFRKSHARVSSDPGLKSGFLFFVVVRAWISQPLQYRAAPHADPNYLRSAQPRLGNGQPTLTPHAI